VNKKETTLNKARLYLTIEQALLNNEKKSQEIVLSMSKEKLAMEICLVSSGLINIEESELACLESAYEKTSVNRLVEIMLLKKNVTELSTMY
jgi:hypothetical protein